MLLGAGCGSRREAPGFSRPGAASASAPSETEQQPSPFGGKPAVDIPPQAKAMGAFLQAEVATEEGDRTEALKALEEAVQYDPDNATLRVTLATLYVRDGRLADARVQADQAVKLDPELIARAAARGRYRLRAGRRYERRAGLQGSDQDLAQEPGGLPVPGHAVRQARRL